MTMRITEAELARDVGAVLDKVQQGSEVVIEREDQRTVAIVSAPPRGGRPIDDSAMQGPGIRRLHSMRTSAETWKR